MKDISFINIVQTVAIIIVFLLGSHSVGGTFGQANPGTAATAASTSAPTLTAGTAQGLFATSTGCISRIVTTQAGYLELTFTDRIGQTPTGSFGVYQAASTTQVYDSGLYGCGYVKALSNVTQAVTLVDVR